MAISDETFDKLIHTFKNGQGTNETCTILTASRACKNCDYYISSARCALLNDHNPDLSVSLARYLKTHPEWAI